MVLGRSWWADRGGPIGLGHRRGYHPPGVTLSPDQLAGAAGRAIPDVAAPDLRVLLCGINPGLLSGASGQHFARPGNRFWKVLHAAGFTDRVLLPSQQFSLLDFGVGITNLVAGASRGASDLTAAELREGAVALERKVAELRPAFVAVLGMQAYRTAFRRPGATIGLQPEPIARLWLLPNPSGLQARYGFAEMVGMFEQLRLAAGIPRQAPDTCNPEVARSGSDPTSS
jgi:TDG/mug DNA glycosylase family protein